MSSISSIIKNVRNIMRQDRGVSGDAQRLEQLGWMVFLKILDEKDQELELIRDGYRSVIPKEFQWRNWAADPEGITGEELTPFIDHPADGLFAALKELKAAHAPQRAGLVREVFDGSNNYMKSGFEMRKVINQLNGFDFNNSADRHIFGTVYESILIELRDAGNKGEYYTPRAITRLMTQMTAPKLGEKVLDPAGHWRLPHCCHRPHPRERSPHPRRRGHPSAINYRLGVEACRLRAGPHQSYPPRP